MLVLDNIVFNIQRAGGVSAVWNAILQACREEKDLNLQIIEKSGAHNNIFYKHLNNAIYRSERLPLSIARYRSPKMPKNATLFHSSYLRTTPTKSVRNIVTVHDFVYEKYDTGIRKMAHLVQKENALKRADVIICVSENTKQDLLTYHPYLHTRDIRVIHNGVDKQFTPMKPECTGAPYLLYVGGRTNHKNFDLALNLILADDARKLDLHLKVVGGGAFSPREQSNFRAKGISNKIKHLGVVSNKQLNRLYAGAFAFIYPSLYEGFGIPPLEAMASGCPVICSNSSSLPEVVGQAALMFDPLSLEQAMDCVFSLMSNEIRSDYIQRGLLQARNFSWEKTGLRTLELYREYLN